MEATTKVGHSAGPWKADGQYIHSEADGMMVAQVRGWGRLTGTGGGLGLPPEEAIAIQDANARLIAQAPTLLAAARLGHADSPGLPAGDLLAAANALRNSGYASLAKRLERKHDAESAAIAAATGEGE